MGQKALLFDKIFKALEVFFIVCLMLKPCLGIFYTRKYADTIQKYSSLNELDKNLVASVISTESKFDPQAVSHKGAKGLMQIKPSTALWCVEKFNISTDHNGLFDPDVNIQIGCRYLRYLSDKFGPDTKAVLAAYNAGEGNVRKWLKNQGGTLTYIPFEETRNYVKKVINKTKIYSFIE